MSTPKKKTTVKQRQRERGKTVIITSSPYQKNVVKKSLRSLRKKQMLYVYIVMIIIQLHLKIGFHLFSANTVLTIIVLDTQ